MIFSCCVLNGFCRPGIAPWIAVPAVPRVNLILEVVTSSQTVLAGVSPVQSSAVAGGNTLYGSPRSVNRLYSLGVSKPITTQPPTSKVSVIQPSMVRSRDNSETAPTVAGVTVNGPGPPFNKIA